MIGVRKRGVVAGSSSLRIPRDLNITLQAGWPPRLQAQTVDAVLARPVPGENANGRAAASPAADPSKLASVVVVTFNSLVFNRLALESVLVNTPPGTYELVIVDNASTDDTPAYLRALADGYGHVRPFLNDRNLGFAAATNQGLKAARGNTLVLLNSDTLVAPGWLERLQGHLADPAVGVVGPLTNRSATEAEIEVHYQTYAEFLEFASSVHKHRRPEVEDVRTLTMFCVAMRRDVYEHVGPLDERFGQGMFEDHDYAMRVRAAGDRVVFAHDAFVHHFGQASMGKLDTDEYKRLFTANRQLFEQKWGARWDVHQRRDPEYLRQIQRLRELLPRALPPRATVAVVSRGDHELLELDGLWAWHFPRAADGGFAGYHPADSAAAIAHVEELRELGAEFLVFPEPAKWWLEHYRELEKHLASSCRVVLDEPGTCRVYALVPEARP